MNLFMLKNLRRYGLYGMMSLLGGLSLAHSPEVLAQQKTTSNMLGGQVLDENGDPLTGATVQVVGTTTGTTVDINGKFSIKSNLAGKKLKVSFMGYKDLVVTAKDGMVIRLEPASQSLNEVVVTGMVATDKRLFTGASDKLKADNIRMAGMADVSRGLEGRSAGVSVQNVSGTFGTAPKIRIRGATSILGSSKPLWVVDGVIQEDVVQIGADDLASGDATTLISSAIAGLNADDIESFQILKDGSATSIYGAKAMAGVIVITTKKGGKGTSTFSYTGEFTSRLKPTYREFNILNSQDQMGVYAEMYDKGWLNFSETFRAPNSGVFGKMYHLTNTYDPKTGTFLVDNTYEGRRNYLRAAELRNTDWFDELFSNAVMMNHSVSMSTGSEKSRTYASVSLMNDPGWMMASNVRRYTASFNNTYDFTPKISLTTLGSMAYRQQKAPGTLSSETDAVNGSVSRAFDINPFSYALNTSRTLDPDEFYQRSFAPFNVKHELANNYIDLNILDFKLQTELKWKPIKGMTVAGLAAVKYSNTDQVSKITEYSNLALAYRAMDDATIIKRNGWLYKDPDQLNSLPFSVLPVGGFYNKDTYRMLSYDFRGSVTYNTEFAGGHILNSYAGIEFNSQDRSRDGFEGWGMQYDSGEVPFYTFYAFKQMLENSNSYYSIRNTFNRTNALFGTATYSYQGKYTLTGTIRYEGSNRLGRSRSARWLPTWNVAGAWNVHEEKFFKEKLSKIFSHLTLKASYSLTADAGPSYVTNSRVIVRTYKPWRPTAGASESGNRITSYENSELTYEKKNEFNVGVDMSLLNRRINITADAYFRQNYDLIGYISTSKGTRLGNVAEMKSSGFELSISSSNIKSKDFSWTTDFVFGYGTNEVTNLKTRTRVFDFISGSGFAREGYPARGLFSIPFYGLDKDGFPIVGGPDKEVNGVKTPTKITKDNYGSIDFQERDNVNYLVYHGPTDPTITGSLGNTFRYKNLSFNLFVTYSAGNKLRLEPVFSSRYTDLDAHTREFNNRWMHYGDEARTDVPVIASSYDAYRYGSLNRGYNAYNYSTARIADGSFVRMKEISMTYTLPTAWLKGKLLKSASIKLQATNLFLIYSDSKLQGQDPEFFRSGGVSSPVPKQFTASIRLGF